MYFESLWYFLPNINKSLSVPQLGFYLDKLDLLPLADDLNHCPIREVSLNYATEGKWYLPSVRRGYFIRDRAGVSLADTVWHNKIHLCFYICHLELICMFVCVHGYCDVSLPLDSCCNLTCAHKQSFWCKNTCRLFLPHQWIRVKNTFTEQITNCNPGWL